MEDKNGWGWKRGWNIFIHIMQLDSGAKEELEQRFVFLSLLGKGSFGCVYECEDRKDGQVYAVKVISKNNVKRTKLECLRQEARLLSNISHPNIVKLYEFVQANTCIFLRMEIIRNGTLESLIKKRWHTGQKFTDEEMSTIIRSVLKVISHIHSLNIIHRDIKPENILIPSEQELNLLKIADFGLSTKLDFYYPKTATSKCGTMLYMAPQILNNLSYSKSVDIWSCSIIMFMLATGKHPFYQSKMTTDEYKNKIRKIVFPPLNNKLAQDFLSRISKVDSNQRYTTQEALKHPWLTRNFDDQIPLSLHQSFFGFEKSHEISNVIKAMLAVRNICHVNNYTHAVVPDSYRLKKDHQIKYTHSLNIKKIKSIKSPINSKSLAYTPSLKKQIEKQNDRKVTEYSHDNQNPTILKLNKIFDSLFERKNRQKEKMYTQIPQTKNKQLILSSGSELPHKEKIENEIEKLVREFKNSDYGRNTYKRMLPKNKKTYSDRFSIESQDSKNGDQLNLSSHKIRYRKKTGSTLRFYE